MINTRLDDRIFDYTSYKHRINPWTKAFFLKMINTTMYEHPNDETFDYQSLLQKDSSYSTETLNVADIDYFINFIISKNLISKAIFSSTIRDEYLSTLTHFSQVELSEATHKLSEAEEKKNRRETEKKEAKVSLDKAKKDKDDPLRLWYDQAKKDKQLNRAKKTFEHAEQRFLRAEKKWKNKKIELEKLTIQFKLIHNSNMHYFFNGLNKRIGTEILSIPRKEIVPIDPLLSEKLFNPETYISEENIWVKDFIKNLVKKTLEQRPFGFASEYNALTEDIFNVKEKDLNVNSTDFILNIIRIKLKLPIEDLIQDGDLKVLSCPDEINRKLNDIEKNHEENIKFLEQKKLSNIQKMNEAQNYIDDYDWTGIPTKKEKMERQLKEAKEKEKQYQEEEILIINNYLKEKAIPVAQKRWLELSNDDPILKEFLGEIANKLTATNLIHNYPSDVNLINKVTQINDAFEKHWLVPVLAPHYSGIDSLTNEYSFQLFNSNLGLSWVKTSALQEKELIVDILAKEGGVALLQDFFKKTGPVKRLLVQNLEDLETFFASLHEHEQSNGLAFLEFMQCPIEAILHEVFHSDLTALPQFVKIIKLLSESNRKLFIAQYETEIYMLVKKSLVWFILNFSNKEKELYKNSNFFIEDKQVVKALFDAAMTTGYADFYFLPSITIEQLFALYEMGVKDFSRVKLSDDFPEYLKEKRLENITVSPENFSYFLESGYIQFTASNAETIIKTLRNNSPSVETLDRKLGIDSFDTLEAGRIVYWIKLFNLKVAEQALEEKVYGLSMNYKESIEKLSGRAISASEAKTYLLYTAQTELGLTFLLAINADALGDKKALFLTEDNPFKYIKNEYLEIVKKGITLTEQISFLQEQSSFATVSSLAFPQQRAFLDQLGVDEYFSKDSAKEEYSITLAERLHPSTAGLHSVNGLLKYRIFDKNFGLSWFKLENSSDDASIPYQSKIRFVDAISDGDVLLFLIAYFPSEHVSQLIQTVDDLYLFFENVSVDSRHYAFKWIINNISIYQILSKNLYVTSNQQENDIQDIFLPNKLLAILKLMSDEDRAHFIVEASKPIKAVLRSLLAGLDLKTRFNQIEEFQGVHYGQYSLISKKDIQTCRELIQTLVDSGYTDFSELTIPFYPLGYGPLDGLKLANTDFSYSHIGTSIFKTNFINAKLDSTHFSGTLLQVNFSNTDLSHTGFINSKIVLSSTMLNSLERFYLNATKFSTRSFSELLITALGDDIFLRDANLNEVDFYNPSIVAKFNKFTKITLPSYFNSPESLYSLRFSSRQVIDMGDAQLNHNACNQQSTLKRLLALQNNSNGEIRIKAFHRITNDIERIQELFFVGCGFDKEDIFIENMNIAYELKERKKRSKLTASENAKLEAFYKNFEGTGLSKSKRSIDISLDETDEIDLNADLKKHGESTIVYDSVNELVHDIQNLKSKSFIIIGDSQGSFSFSLYKKPKEYNVIYLTHRQDESGFGLMCMDITDLKEVLKLLQAELPNQEFYVHGQKKSMPHTSINPEFFDPLVRTPEYLMILDSTLGNLNIGDLSVPRSDLALFGVQIKAETGDGWLPIDGNSIKTQIEFDSLRRSGKIKINPYVYFDVCDNVLAKRYLLKNQNVLKLVGNKLPFQFVDQNIRQKVQNYQVKMQNFLKQASFSSFKHHSLNRVHQFGKWRVSSSMSKRQQNYVAFGNYFMLFKSGYGFDTNLLKSDLYAIGLSTAEIYLAIKQNNIYKWVEKGVSRLRGRWFTANKKILITNFGSGLIGQLLEPINLLKNIDSFSEANGLERNRLAFQIGFSSYSLTSTNLLMLLSSKFPKFVSIGGVTSAFIVFAAQTGVDIHYTLEKYEYLNFSFKERGNIGLNTLLLFNLPPFLQDLLNEENNLFRLALDDLQWLSLNPKTVLCVSAIGQNDLRRTKRAIGRGGASGIGSGSKSMGKGIANTQSGHEKSRKALNKKKYLHRKPIVAEVDLREGQDKNEILLSRIALEPSKLPPNTFLACSPGFRSIDPAGSGKSARTEIFNSKNVQCIANTTRLENLSPDEGEIKIDTSFFQDESVVYGSDKWNNDFYINSDSKASLYGGSNNYGNKTQINHFIYEDKKFPGHLYGGIASDIDRKVTNVLDLRLLDEVKKINYKNSTLELDGNLVTAQNMNYYFGPVGAAQEIDCDTIPLKFVSVRDGTEKEINKLRNCKMAEIYPYTEVTSNLSGTHTYNIRFGQGDVSINALQAEKINLIFSDCNLLSTHHSVNFFYHPKENILEVEFIKNFKTLRVKSTFLGEEGNPKLNIFDNAARLIVNFGNLSAAKEAGKSLTNLSIQQIKSEEDGLVEAPYLEKIYASLTKKQRITTTISGKSSDSTPTAMVASAFNDYIIIEELAKNTNTIYGGEGADVYHINPNSERIVINNFSEDSKIDELNFSNNDLSELILQQKNADLVFQYKHKNILKFYNFFKKKEYQHLQIKNTMQNLLPIQKEAKLQLVPYLRFQEQGPLISIDKNMAMLYPDIAIDTNLNNLNAFRKNDDLLLATNPNYRRLFKENYFISVSFIDYYLHPEVFDAFTLWGAPEGELIKANESNKFDKSALGNFATLALDWQLLEKQAFTTYSVAVVPFIEEFQHNQVSLNGNYSTVPDEEKKGGLIELVDFDIGDAKKIKLKQQGCNLVISFLDRTHKPRKEVVIKNWDNPFHRIDSLVFNDQFVVNGLSMYGLDNLSGMQQHIDKAGFTHLVQAELEKDIAAEDFEDLKIILYLRALDKAICSSSYLGFYSPSQEEGWVQRYFIKHGKTQGFKRLETIFTGEAGKNRIKALFWYAIEVNLVLEVDSSDIRDFFDLIPEYMFFLFPDFTNKTRTIDQKLHHIKINLSFFAQQIQDIYLQDFPQWMANLTQAFNETIEEERGQTSLFSIDEEQMQGDQAEIEPRVGAQVHSAYQEEQMLGDQPVNGFIQGESYATYSTEPPLLGTDPANSPSLMGIIKEGVEVNSTLLALNVMASKMTGSKYSSSIPNFSIESQTEERIEALASTIIPALIEGEGKWEKSESESASGFWNNWLVIGGLGAGVGVVGSLIAVLVCWIKRGRAKNLSSNDDLETGITKPLNSRDENSLENGDSSNLIPASKRTTLFGDDDEEEEGGADGSSSFSFPMNNLFVQDSDWHVETKLQKKTVKHAQERVA